MSLTPSPPPISNQPLNYAVSRPHRPKILTAISIISIVVGIASLPVNFAILMVWAYSTDAGTDAAAAKLGDAFPVKVAFGSDLFLSVLLAIFLIVTGAMALAGTRSALVRYRIYAVAKLLVNVVFVWAASGILISASDTVTTYLLLSIYPFVLLCVTSMRSIRGSTAIGVV